VGLENLKGFSRRWQSTDGGPPVLQSPRCRRLALAELKDLIETSKRFTGYRRANGPAEYESGHAPRAVTAPLAKLREMLPTLGLNPDRPSAIICAGGYRSSAATSIAQQLGFTNLLNVTGGHNRVGKGRIPSRDAGRRAN
jgi:hypothetical protein